MKKYFSQDTVPVGIVAGIGSEMMVTLLLTVVLLAIGEPVADHLRWYGSAFIPLILVLRQYAKSQQHPKVVKTLIVVFFITFLAYIFLLFHTHTLQL